MADFCASCTEIDGLPGNDLDNWLRGLPGYAWTLCEGCGDHRFDNAGRRACQPTTSGREVVSPAGGLLPCPDCIAHAIKAQEFRATLPIAVSVFDLAREIAASLIDVFGSYVPNRRVRTTLERVALRVQAQR